MAIAPEFDWTGQQFTTIDDFRKYLSTITPPVWATHFVLHHTAVPTVAQWRGKASMDGMASWYRDKLRWRGGPHVFFAPDGIWEGTTITEKGVHAYEYNSFAIGGEVVGNYDSGPWVDPICEFTFAGIAAILQWARIPVANVIPHRDANLQYKHEYKSCPGDYIYKRMHQVRYELNLRLGRLESTSACESKFDYYEVISGTANVRQAPDPNAPEVIDPATGKPMRLKAGKPEATFGVDKIIKGTMVKRGNIQSDQWAHRADQLGFVWLPSLRKI